MSKTQTRVFPARFSSLATIGEFVTQAAGEAGLNDQDSYAVQMAVDEACSNIIEHAYDGVQAGEICCTYHITPVSLVLTLSDKGRRFDPTRVAEPDVEASLEDRMRGGLGIHFIRKLMDRVEYESPPGLGNVLTLVKHREPTP